MTEAIQSARRSWRQADEPSPEQASGDRRRAIDRRLEVATERAAGYAELKERAAPRALPTDLVEKVHPERSFRSLEPLATEVLRLRRELARTDDPVTRAALGVRIRQLGDQWCAMARAAGLSPPPASFDPYRASDAELKNAILWTEVGNCFPTGSFASPVHPDRFRDDILSAWTLRTPGMLEKVVAADPRNPALVPLLRAELARLGDRDGCRAGDTVEELLARRAQLLGAARAVHAEPDQLYIGLDGRIGTKDALGRYEAEQYLLAINPGTTMGALLAAVAATSGGDVEAIRRSGAAGNAAEALGQGKAPTGDMSTGTKKEQRW